MSSESLQTWAYQLGEPHPNTNTHPNVETKPTYTLDDSGRVQTGGGYEHARSTEWRPHTPTQGKESVYASIHRLCAVAWCFEDGVTAEEIDMAGMDVHHEHPDEWVSGVEWLNIHDSPNLPEAGLEVMGHGEHSEVTNADKRAWAEDAKKRIDAAETAGDTCDTCGVSLETPCQSEGFEGTRCVPCAKEECDGHPIEVG